MGKIACCFGYRDVYKNINEKTCRMVIDYLEKVMETRAERMAYRYDKR